MATAKKAAKKTAESTKAPAAAKKAPVSPKVQRSINKLTKDIASHIAKKSAAISKITELRAQLKSLKNPAA